LWAVAVALLYGAVVLTWTLAGPPAPGGEKNKAAPKSQNAAKSKKPVRSLFGSGHGRFRTQGKHAAATVRGTIWITEDYCDRTVIRVKRGVVGVKDLRTGKVVAVRAGSSRTIRRR